MTTIATSAAISHPTGLTAIGSGIVPSLRNRLPGVTLARPASNGLKPPGLLGESNFCRQALHRRGAVEALAQLGLLHDEFGIPRLGDRPAVRQHDHVVAHLAGRRCPLVHEGGTVLELAGRPGTDRAAGG